MYNINTSVLSSYLNVFFFPLCSLTTNGDKENGSFLEICIHIKPIYLFSYFALQVYYQTYILILTLEVLYGFHFCCWFHFWLYHIVSYFLVPFLWFNYEVFILLDLGKFLSSRVKMRLSERMVICTWQASWTY